MAKKKRANNSVVTLRAGESIGAPAAEQDHANLRDCFVELPIIDLLKKVDDPHCILLGRTGAGKSAIVWHLEQTAQKPSRIDPTEASFEYVANSTIIRYFAELGVELHVFYQYLWKHIIVVHVIRECLGVKTEESFKLLLKKLTALVVRDQKKAVVISYLERWNRGFWIDAEEVSREITTNLAKKLSAELGIAVEKLNARLAEETSTSESERKNIQMRAQRIVNDLQMRELNETISALSDLLAARAVGYHILIDDLDAEWGGNAQTQYDLLRALIECIKTFRRISNLKIVVAMREDLYEGMIRSVQDARFQPEKFDGLLCRIRWKDVQLYRVIEARLNRLFHQRYTGQGVTWEHVLPADIKGTSTRGYIVERTLKRPRDVIAFINKILEGAEGATLPLSSKAVLSSEANYSRDRLSNLAREWQACHPFITTYLNALAGSKERTTVRALGEDELGSIALEVDALERKPGDEVEQAASRVFKRNKEQAWPPLAQAVTACLFKVGAIGVKLRADLPYKFCYEEHSTIQTAEILPDTKIVVHPMVAPALGVRPARAEAA